MYMYISRKDRSMPTQPGGLPAWAIKYEEVTRLAETRLKSINIA